MSIECLRVVPLSKVAELQIKTSQRPTVAQKRADSKPSTVHVIAGAYAGLVGEVIADKEEELPCFTIERWDGMSASGISASEVDIIERAELVQM